jgi:hypothetical protein
VPFSGIDQEHLPGANFPSLGTVVEMQAPLGDDESDRDRVPMLGHVLPWLEAQAHDPHRPAIGDLLESKRTMLSPAWR